ncbi:MAG: hypothetical protein ACI9FO_000322, partial [Methylophagaceae bacterium]
METINASMMHLFISSSHSSLFSIIVNIDITGQMF